ncbi:tyrosine-type recombinase/integrase [Dawidia soli]|uniref:Tyrosine-type recombinase/integrase n=1 Tax=Dawidia soli TaxID=2782352 RepID=A0AAP2DD68_9BACT|nr:phage integrase SAM-like domain-containing protein [Dawidia soli]MBT1689883.1 tyrosine-type recombinase/integrase [Dawidia soli]
MTTIKITLDKREDHTHVDKRYPVVLRIGHKRKTRDIPFNIAVHEKNFDPVTGKVTGILNAVQNTKRVQRILAETDLWVTENGPKIKFWSVAKLKAEIERKFFEEQFQLSLLTVAGKLLYRLCAEERFTTADSYEGALKAFIRYRMVQMNKEPEDIKTLYNKDILKESHKQKKGEDTKGFEVLPEYTVYDLPIIAIDRDMMQDFKAHLAKTCGKNTIGIYLRSLNVFFNDASKSHKDELGNHSPLEDIKKGSYENEAKPWTMEELNRLRKLDLEPGSGLFEARDFVLTMFNNMGMNFFDLALLRVSKFDGERLSYSRKKTINAKKKDTFSIKQSDEALEILQRHIQGKSADDYIFPILTPDIPTEQVHEVKAEKLRVFNKRIKVLCQKAGIKEGSSYTVRDTWTDVGLERGVNIRAMSSGLGHEDIRTIDKHYTRKLNNKALDKANAKITGQPKTRKNQKA